MTTSFAIGWRQVASCFVLFTACSFITSGYSFVAVPLGHEFHPSRMELGLVMTIMAGVTGLVAPLLGSLLDRVSVRLMMLLGTVCFSAGYVAVSFTTSITQVMVIFGLLIAPANILIGPVAGTVLIARWFVKRRGAAIGVAISGIAMGSVIYPPIFQALLGHYEWREAFRIFAAIVLVLTVPAAALVINRPADKGLNPDGLEPERLTSGLVEEAPDATARDLVTDPAFWLAAIILGTGPSAMAGMITNLAPMAIDNGVSPQAVAALSVVYGGTAFVAKMSFAVVADRLSPRTLMFISLAGFASGMACLTQASAGYWAIVLGVGLVGMFGGIMVPMQSFIVPRIFGQRVVGKAMGLLSMVMLVALLSTPPLFGRVYDVTGSYSLIFAVFVGLAIGVMLLVPHLRLHPRTEEEARPALATT